LVGKFRRFFANVTTIPKKVKFFWHKCFLSLLAGSRLHLYAISIAQKNGKKTQVLGCKSAPPTFLPIKNLQLPIGTFNGQNRCLRFAVNLLQCYNHIYVK
jgi:hypothetical protein